MFSIVVMVFATFRLAKYRFIARLFGTRQLPRFEPGLCLPTDLVSIQFKVG